MIDVVLTDSELIYYIKQSNKEAYELLFLRYKTKMRYFAKKCSIDFLLDRDKDYLEEVYINSLNEAINTYYCNKGLFSLYFISVFKYKIYSSLNKKKNYFINEVPSADMEQLQDTYDYSLNEEINRCLKLLSRFDKRCYRIIIYWMQGLSYEEIADNMKVTVKVVAYLIRRGLSFLKDHLL